MFFSPVLQYERFFRPQTVVVASVYCPIVYPPTPVLVFNDDISKGEWKNMSICVLKKAVFTVFSWVCVSLCCIVGLFRS